MKAHCLFEQSGTFKNVLKEFGIDAVDYDIQNEYGQTDYQIDLFAEIEKAYSGGGSIFDRIEKDDICFAFFPCTYFSHQNYLVFSCNWAGIKEKTQKGKLEYVMQREKERALYFELFCKFYQVLLRKKIKCVIENPYHIGHYLTKWFPIKPSIIDKDRRKRGDKFIKPTQFWFVNIEPKQNIELRPQYLLKSEMVVDYNTKERSEITSEYARNFIKEFIL